MISNCLILHNSVFLLYNHLAFFITTCYCFIMCLCVFLSCGGFSNHLFRNLFHFAVISCLWSLLAPSHPSIHAVVILVWEVLFHEMLFFQALSHDHLPVEWIGFFFDSLHTHLILLLIPAPIDPINSGSCTWRHLFSAGRHFLLSVTLQAEPAKRTYPF